MRPNLTLFGLAAITSLTVSVKLPLVPDNFGLFTGETYDNGTTIFESLTNPELTPIVVHEPTVLTRSAKFGLISKLASLSKRRTDCWGTQLDGPGVDVGIADLANWAGNGNEVRTDPGRNKFVGSIYKAVITYYCISQPNSVGNLDSNDVWYAHNQMNSACRQYVAGWFGWPGSVEIVGRAREGTSICNPGGPW